MLNIRYRVGGYMAVLITVVYAIFLSVNAKNTIVSAICATSIKYYILMALVIISVYFAAKEKTVFWAYVGMMFLFFGWLSFADTSYSIIDESMNFENINHIVTYNKLPVWGYEIDYVYLNMANNGVDSIGAQVNHEVVQAPLFYLLFAVVGKFIGSAYARFHVFRILSLLMVLVIYLFVDKTVKILKKTAVINDELLRLAMLLTIFNPGYLYRASRINNEILVCVLCSILLYVAIKCVYEGYKPVYYWMMAFLSIACFMTKNTAAYAYVVIAVVAIMQKKIIKAVAPVFVSVLFAVPWFAFNYSVYGSLTGIAKHLEYVLAIVNPTGARQDLFNSVFYYFACTCFAGQDVLLPDAEIVWTNTLFVILIFMICYLTYRVLMEIWANKLSFEKYDVNLKLNIVCLSLMAACIMFLVAGTITTRIECMLGRYFYGAGIGLIFILVLNEKKLIFDNVRAAFFIVSIVAMGITFTRVGIDSLDKVYAANSLYADNIGEIEVYDWSDENWNRGYSTTGNYVLIKLTDDSNGDYTSLIGSGISNGYSKAIITAVSGVAQMGDDRCVWAMTSRHMEPNGSGDNILQVTNHIIAQNYNTGEIGTDIGNVEEAVVSQSFKAENDGNLWAVAVDLSVYSVDNYSARVEYMVSDESGQVLGSGDIDIANISDNEYCTIYFDEPISLEVNNKYIISLVFDNSDNLPIAIKASDNDSYADGELSVGDQIYSENDMGFKLLMQ